MSTKTVTSAVVSSVLIALILGGALYFGLRSDAPSLDPLDSERADVTAGFPETSPTSRPPADLREASVGDGEPEVTEQQSVAEGRIAGRVTADDGSPLPDAVVRAKRIEVPEHQLHFDLRGGITISPPGPDEKHDQTISEQDGHFALASLRPGLYSVFAWHEGYRMGSVHALEVTNGGEAQADVELAAALSLTGRVMDPEGQPVAGAEVTGHLGTGFFSERGDAVKRMSWAPPEGETLDSFRAVSDSEGWFELAGLWPKHHTVIALHPDWAPGRIDNVIAGSSELVIRMVAGAEVSGVVIDSTGSGVAGVNVFVKGGDPRAGESTVTAKDGSFRLGMLAPRTVDLRAWGEGYPTAAVDGVELSTAEPLRDLEIVLPDGGRLSGVVVDTAGEPIEAADVRLKPVAEGRYEVGRNARTDADGRFSILGLTPGESYTGTVRHHAWVPAGISPFEAPEGTIELDPLVLTAGTTLRGSVVDLAGEPVADARLEVRVVQSEYPLHRRNDSRTSKGTDANDQGSFEIRRFGEGTYRIRIRAPGFARFESEPIALSGNGDIVEQDFTLGRGQRIGGEVVDHEGRPVAGAAIRVTGPSGGTSARASSDDAGRFVVRGLAPGTYRVSASRLFLGDAVEKVDAGSDVRLILRGRGRITGRVVDAWTGLAVEAFSVLLVPRKETGRPDMSRLLRGGLENVGSRFANPEGTFVLPEVDAGRHTLVIQASGYALYRDWEVRVTAGETVDVRVALEAGGAVRGRVVDTEGRPIARARVRMLEDEETETNVVEISWSTSEGVEYRRFGGSDLVMTDEAGRFVLPDLPAGTFALSVKHDDYISRTLPGVQSAARQELTLAEPIELKPGVRIHGTVRDVSGKATSDARVRVYRLDDKDKEIDPTDISVREDGTFSKRGFKSGRYAIVVGPKLNLSLTEWRRMERTRVDLTKRKVTEVDLVISPRS